MSRNGKGTSLFPSSCVFSTCLKDGWKVIGDKIPIRKHSTSSSRSLKDLSPKPSRQSGKRLEELARKVSKATGPSGPSSSQRYGQSKCFCTKFHYGRFSHSSRHRLEIVTFVVKRMRVLVMVRVSLILIPLNSQDNLRSGRAKFSVLFFLKNSLVRNFGQINENHRLSMLKL